MKLKKIATLATLAGSVMVSQAGTFEWAYSAIGLTASGTLTTAGDALVPEDVLTFSGTRGTDLITGIVPLGVDPGFNYDNQFQLPAPSTNTAGILFNVGGGVGNVNLYFESGAYHEYTYSGLPGNINDRIVSFTVAPVPEPETYAMMLAGLGVIVALSKRKKQKLTLA